MFNLFKKREPGKKVKDIIWISCESKWKAIISMAKENDQTIFAFWFENSLQQAQNYFQEQQAVIHIATVTEIRQQSFLQGKPVIFAEHFPLRKKEQETFESLAMEEATVLSALDEPLFKRFGSDKIIQLVKQMGMKEEERIEHHLIANAIRNAQENIEEKVVVSHDAHSQQEWLEKNLPAGNN